MGFTVLSTNTSIYHQARVSLKRDLARATKSFQLFYHAHI